MKHLLFSLTLLCNVSWAQNLLLIPDTISGNSINLNLQNGTVDFYPGITTQTMGVNGNLLGPTIFLNYGDSINFSVNNQLSDSTTIHWHGMHISAENDGGPHTVIPPGSTWNPGFMVRDKAATYWYHPHLHKKTNLHVSKGIAGFIFVRDAEEAALNLPRTYGLDDIPLVFQTKAFDTINEIQIGVATDTLLTVNGTPNPIVDLPGQIIRLRLLNGASQRVFNFGLTNNQTFYQIASDGGLLSSPVSLTRLLLAPGERAEILVDLFALQGQTIALINYGSEIPAGIYGASQPGNSPSQTIPGYSTNPLNGTDTTLLQINVVTPTFNAVTSIPSTLATVTPIDPATSNLTRNLFLSAEVMGSTALNNPFTIDGNPFDMNVINQVIPLNNTEIWEIYNGSPISHPFHIHDVQFYILDRNGNTPALNEQGRKDVILIRPMETIHFITKFEDFSNDSVPYMYHCHMLNHEDDGMMGQFVVVNNVGVNETERETLVKPYPNPCSDYFTVGVPDNEKLTNVCLFDLHGRLIKSVVNRKMFVGNLAKGTYYVTIETENSVSSSLLIKH